MYKIIMLAALFFTAQASLANSVHIADFSDDDCAYEVLGSFAKFQTYNSASTITPASGVHQGVLVEASLNPDRMSMAVQSEPLYYLEGGGKTRSLQHRGFQVSEVQNGQATITVNGTVCATNKRIRKDGTPNPKRWKRTKNCRFRFTKMVHEPQAYVVDDEIKTPRNKTCSFRLELVTQN